MKTCSRYYVMLLGVLACVLAAFPGDLYAVPDVYWPRVLFSLPYGPEPEQVGVLPGTHTEGDEPSVSLAPLVVPREDVILMVDRVQRRIKRFACDGELVVLAEQGVAQPDTPGEAETIVRLDHVGGVAGDPEGRFYTGTHGRLQVFDSDGKLQVSQRDATGELVEAKGWDLIKEQLRAVPVIGARQDLTVLAADTDGHLYVGVSPTATEYNVTLVKFDANLQLVGTRPGFMVGWDGRTYGFAPNREPEPNDQLRVYSPSGEVETTITLEPPPDIGKGDYDNSIHRWRAAAGVLFDANGCSYMVLNCRRARDQWVEIAPGFIVADDTVVYKFDPNGAFVTKLVFDGLPFDIYPPVAVDPAGNVYHMEYCPDRVDFVREELVVYAAGSGGAPPSRHVSLREGLEPRGWMIAWNPATHTATARRGDTKADVSPGGAAVTINGQEIPLSPAPMLASGRVRVPESLIARLLAADHGPATFARLAR